MIGCVGVMTSEAFLFQNKSLIFSCFKMREANLHATTSVFVLKLAPKPAKQVNSGVFRRVPFTLLAWVQSCFIDELLTLTLNVLLWNILLFCSV